MLRKKSPLDSWKKLKTMKKNSRIKKRKKRKRTWSSKGLKSLIKIWLNKKSKPLKIVKRKEKRDFKRSLMIWKETRVKRNKKKNQRRNQLRN